MSAQSVFSRGLRSAIFASLAAASPVVVTGCGVAQDPVGTAQSELSVAYFSDDFEGDLVKWDLHHSQPTDPAHIWTITSDVPFAGASGLRSDPIGSIKESQINIIESKVIDLSNSAGARLKLFTRFDLPPNHRFQVFVTGGNVGRSLIADLGPRNLAWPNYESLEVDIPPQFQGLSDVKVSFNFSSGVNVAGFEGVFVDNVEVVAVAGSKVFSDGFNTDLSQWSLASFPVGGAVDNPPAHTWFISGGNGLQSDVVMTEANRFNTITSAFFSLAGKSSATVLFKEKHSLIPDARLQVFVEADGLDPSLIIDLAGQNAVFPSLQSIEADIPAVYLGNPSVRLRIQVITGPIQMGSFGAAIDDICVIAD